MKLEFLNTSGNLLRRDTVILKLTRYNYYLKSRFLPGKSFFILHIVVVQSLEFASVWVVFVGSEQEKR